MAYTDSLVQASFKGVPFLVNSESIPEGGRRIAIHDYVNSSERFVEDLGEIPESFKVDAFVTGADWQAQRAALERVLREEGAGPLYLPALGRFMVHAQPFSSDISQKNIGIVRFNLSFVRGKKLAGPVAAPVDVHSVYTKGDSLRRTLLESFEDFFNEIDDALGFSVFISDVIAAANEIFDAISSILTLEGIRIVSEAVDNIVSFAGNLIRNIQDLGGALLRVATSFIPAGLWAAVSSALSLLSGEPLKSAFRAMINLTRWGNNLTITKRGGESGYKKTFSAESGYQIALWPSTTTSRISRNQNRESWVRCQRVNALVCAYEVAAAIDYDTEDEIFETRQYLEEAHDTIMRKDIEAKNAIQARQPIRFAIEDVRVSSLLVIEQAAVNAWKVGNTTIQSKRSSASLAHSLYAETDLTIPQLEERAISIRGLNPSLSAIALDGTVRVLQNE